MPLKIPEQYFGLFLCIGLYPTRLGRKFKLKISLRVPNERLSKTLKFSKKTVSFQFYLEFQLEVLVGVYIWSIPRVCPKSISNVRIFSKQTRFNRELSFQWLLVRFKATPPDGFKNHLPPAIWSSTCSQKLIDNPFECNPP